MKDQLLIRNATIITLDKHNRIIKGNVAINNGVITSIGNSTADAVFDDAAVIDATGLFLLPGFVQTHIHLCQTLFRGAADDLALIDWLKQRVWPMEAAHTASSIYASARLGIAEMIRGGTTCALTMETVHHTDAVFRAVEESGFRATLGKCMMDQGEDVPESMIEKTDDSINESLELFYKWNGTADGRIRYCFAPRFAVSCTRELLERVAKLSKEHNILVHTHASENRDEIEMVLRQTGKRNIAYLNDVGLASANVVLAHCIHLDDDEFEILRQSGAHVAHCPSSNLKLASGVARIKEMLDRGISVSLGADGAPCNNRLDMFTEMRTAALLQKINHGPQALPALTALRMATINGARALGLDHQIGSIEPGKRADLQLLNLDQPHSTPCPDPVSTIVYAAEAVNVVSVIIDGKVVLKEGRLVTLNETEILRDAAREFEMLDQKLIKTGKPRKNTE